MLGRREDHVGKCEFFREIHLERGGGPAFLRGFPVPGENDLHYPILKTDQQLLNTSIISDFFPGGSQ